MPNSTEGKAHFLSALRLPFGQAPTIQDQGPLAAHSSVDDVLAPMNKRNILYNGPAVKVKNNKPKQAPRYMEGT